jgi:predicted permease
MIRSFRIEPYRAGSVFSSSMFSNISALSAFIVFVLFGDEGFAYVQLYALFEQPLYYTVGFPLSYAVSTGALRKFRFSPRLLLDKPVAFFPLGAVFIGVLLRLSGIAKPDFMYTVSKLLVPLITFLFGIAIGITLKVSRTARYRKEIVLIHFVKFLIVPALVIPLGLFAGFAGISGGVPLKALAIVSFSPVAFLAVIPPTIYGFDVDLANSAWLVTTLSFVLIVPLLILVL